MYFDGKCLGFILVIARSLPCHGVIIITEEDKLIGWCWVDGAVPDKSLFNTVSSMQKAMYDTVPTRVNDWSSRMFVAVDSTTC